MFKEGGRLWVVHIGMHPEIAARAQAEGFVCIGWGKAGDLSAHRTKDAMRAAYERAFPAASPGNVSSCYSQLFRFAHQMQAGDAVVYPIKGSREVLIGEVSGPYQHKVDDPQLREVGFVNVRPVRWLRRVARVVFSQSALRSFGSFSSISQSDEFLPEVNAVLAKPEVEASDATAGVVEPELQAEADESGAAFAAEEASESTKDHLIKSWSQSGLLFEEVVGAVFRALGYTATVQQGTHDLGVDVVAHRDPLGVESPIIKVQVKSGTGKTGAPAVKQLRGVLNPGEKGIVVALGGFSPDAKHTEQNDSKLVLIDGERFVDLFLSCYERLSPEMRHRYPLKQVWVVAE